MSASLKLSFAAFKQWVRGARGPVELQKLEFLQAQVLRELSYTHGLTCNLGPPQIFELETTNHCPYTCVMCPRTHAMTRAVGHMDFGLFCDIIDQLHPAWQKDRAEGAPLIRLLHYGEPVVYPHFVESIRHCHRRGLRVHISTNPSVWNERRIEEMLDAGLDDMTVMMDGMDDATSMAIRGRAASFVRGDRNLRRLAQRKTERGLQRPGITVAMVKQPRNAHQWEEFREYWKGVEGIDTVYLGHYSTFDGNVSEINSIGAALAEGDAEQACQLERQAELARFPCYYPWHSVSVTWAGKVVPCCRDYNETSVLGDLRKESLQAIWNGSKLRRLRREFASGKVVNPLCATCQEPSLEIGLPGARYPVARWLRRFGLGRRSDGNGWVSGAADMTGAQNVVVRQQS